MYKQALLSIIKRYNQTPDLVYYFVVFQFKTFVIVKTINKKIQECDTGVVSDAERMSDLSFDTSIDIRNVCYGIYLPNHNNDYTNYSIEEQEELAYANCIENMLLGNRVV